MILIQTSKQRIVKTGMTTSTKFTKVTFNGINSDINVMPHIFSEMSTASVYKGVPITNIKNKCVLDFNITSNAENFSLVRFEPD